MLRIPKSYQMQLLSSILPWMLEEARLGELNKRLFDRITTKCRDRYIHMVW